MQSNPIFLFPFCFVFLYRLIFFLPIGSLFFFLRPPPAAGPPRRLHQFNTGIRWSGSNSFVSVFVCPAGCFSHCFRSYTFLFMAFSSVSATLAIFCLVAPNMPLCLSAATTRLIYRNAGGWQQIIAFTPRGPKMYISGYLLCGGRKKRVGFVM